MRFYLLTALGIRPILQKELKIREINYQFVGTLCTRGEDILAIDLEDENQYHNLLNLQTVETILVDIPEKRLHFQPIHELRKSLDKIDLHTKIISVSNSLNINFPARATFHTFIKSKEDYDIKRKEIAEIVNRALLGSFPNWRLNDPANVEFWGILADYRLALGLRVLDNKRKLRKDYRIIERQGALRGSVAASMALVTYPEPSDVILDPMCGTGSILIERYFMGPYSEMYGIDSDSEATKISKLQIERLGIKNITIQTMDSRKLPFPSNMFSKIVTNLPFGKKYGSKAQNPSLYSECLKEWNRVLIPGGIMCLLTSDTESIESSLKALNALRILRIYRVNVLGIWSSLYCIRKKKLNN